MFGGGQITCGLTETWSKKPICTFKQCPPKSFQNGLNCLCDPGRKGTIKWDLTKKDWEGSCLPDTCGKPNALLNANVATNANAAALLLGGKATYKCKPGYTGGGNIDCQAGWKQSKTVMSGSPNTKVSRRSHAPLPEHAPISDIPLTTMGPRLCRHPAPVHHAAPVPPLC